LASACFDFAWCALKFGMAMAAGCHVGDDDHEFDKRKTFLLLSFLNINFPFC
jgi:hypothetical protein